MTMEIDPYGIPSWDLRQPQDIEREYYAASTNEAHSKPDEQSSTFDSFHLSPCQLASCLLESPESYCELAPGLANIAQEYQTTWEQTRFGISNEAMMISEYQHSISPFELLDINEGDLDIPQYSTQLPSWPFALSPGQDSPIPDLCDTPEDSHASSIKWDQDRETEDMRASKSPISPMVDLASLDLFPEIASEDDSLTPLEMPDGSLRMSSNWMPVDTSAGFIIGSRSSTHRLKRVHGLHMDPSLDVLEAFMRPEN